MAQSKAKCEHVSESPIASGKWLCLKHIEYKDPEGKMKSWEGVSRTTTVNRAGTKLDAVAVLPIYQRTLHKDCLICIRQYRPTMKSYTIELPAGLVDQDEEPSSAAMRELLEETGYTGKVKHMSPATSLDAGVSDSKMILVTAEVDGDDPVNQHPKQSLSGDETSIEVLILPFSDIIHSLNAYSAAGDVVDSRLYSYAIAFTQTTKEKKVERLIKLEQC